MAKDFNEPILGKISTASKELDALLARIGQAKTRVQEVERAAGPAAGGGGGGAGRRPPAPPTGGGGGDIPGDGGRRGQYKKLLADIERLEGQAAGSTALHSDELRRQIQLYGTSSNALRKHGALTTEFLAEAGKGRVTLSELRYQVGATIAKFAGWTAAAAAVYGIVGALQQVGKGAIDASTGVNQLQRVLPRGQVDRGQAQEGFRRNAAKFNLPIDDTSQAQYQLGKVFQNQDDSYKGTEALLYAVKVGELEVNDASKLLISTINAFGLTVDDLMPLMDQYNSLQNGMGVATRDTAAGVAKASGQWRAAGGSLRYLTTLVGAGTKVTGLSGDQFGTLLQRSAGLVGRPANQQALRTYGIDPRQNIEQIIRDALKVAPTLPRSELVGLAQALSTPQLAPRFTALLGRPDIVSRAERLTSPAVAEGSSARELAVVLKGFQERMSRISNDLQQVGASLATSGILVAPGAALTALDHGLRLLSDIGTVFGHLNPEMTAAVVTIGQIALLMKVLRRFNVGDSFAAAMPATAGLFRQSPERRSRTLIGGAQDRELAFYETERERVARSAAVAQRRALAAAATSEALVNAGPAAFGGNKKQYRNALALQQKEVNAATQVAAGLANEEANLRAEIAAAQARSNAFQAQVIRGDKTALAFAAEHNIYFPPHLGLPTVDPLGDPHKNIPTTTGGPSRALGSRAATFEAAASGYVLKERQWNAAVSDTRAYQAAERAGLAGISATARGAAAAGRAGLVMKELAGGVASLGASLLAGLASPMGLLIAATVGLPILIEHVNQRNRELQADLDKTARVPVTEVRRKDLTRRRRQEQAGADKPAGFISDVLNTVGQNVPLFGAFVQHDTSLPKEDRLRQQHGRNAQILAARERRQRTAAAFGQPIPQLALADVNQLRDDSVKQFQTGTHTKKEREEALAKILEEYDKSLAAASGDASKLKRVTQAKQRARADFASLSHTPTKDLYAGMGIDDIQKRVQDYIDIAKSGRSVDENLSKARIALNTAVGSIGPHSTPGQVAQVAQLQSSIATGIQETARQELDSNLAFAKTSGQRARAYQKYRDTLRKQLVTGPHRDVSTAQNALAATQGQLTAAQEDVDTLEQGRRYTAPQMRAALGRVDKLDAKRDARRRDVKVAKEIEKVFAKFFNQFIAGITEDAQSMEESKFNEDASLAQAEAEVSAHGLQAGAPRTRFMLARIGRLVNEAVRRFGHDNKTTLGLIQQQQQLQDQLASDVEAEAEANDTLFVAGAGTPAERARRTVVTLRRKLGRFRAHPGQHSAADITGVLAELRNAQRDFADQIISDARELINAQAAYDASGTDDPIQQARIEARRTGQILKKGGFKTKAEKLTAKAEDRTADRNLVRTKQQGAYDDIQFLADIGKISADEERRRLRRLLKTVNLTKDLKRQIMRDLHALDQETEGTADINVGNVRLPSLYEIRRSIGAAGQGMAITQSFSTTVNVRRGSDVAAVASVQEKYHRTGGKAIRRAAGKG